MGLDMFTVKQLRAELEARTDKRAMEIVEDLRGLFEELNHLDILVVDMHDSEILFQNSIHYRPGENRVEMLFEGV